MRYASLNGGKRFRPFPGRGRPGCSASPTERALMVGAALECVHCYSLVHDDLPAMDNDDLRRGRPTAHKAFDEASAILAGDGLLTFAFDVWRVPRPIPTPACVSSWSWRSPAAPVSAAWSAARCSILPPKAVSATAAAQARRGGGQDAAGDEDGRVAPLRLRGGRHFRRAKPAEREALERSALPSARRFRSPTISSTMKGTALRSARRPARMPRRARRRSSGSSASSGRASGSRGSSPRRAPQ